MAGGLPGMAVHDLVSQDSVPHSQRERWETAEGKNCESLA